MSHSTYRTRNRHGTTYGYYDCVSRSCRFRVRTQAAHAAFVTWLNGYSLSAEQAARLQALLNGTQGGRNPNADSLENAWAVWSPELRMNALQTLFPSGLDQKVFTSPVPVAPPVQEFPTPS